MGGDNRRQFFSQPQSLKGNAMAKFMGSVSLDASKGYIELKAGNDYVMPDETLALVQDTLALAKEHNLRISAFAPDAEGGTKVGYATTWAAAQIAKLIAAGRTPLINQAKKARFPAPYFAMLMPEKTAPAAKPAKAGPDLSRKAKPAAEPTGPNLARKR
jgi:hypothetical protein